ncbi:MAG: protein-glutamate methylesterase/protein-glutamine glutaminase [Fibrobacterota bacterium]
MKRVLIVDDSLVYRRILSGIISEIPNLRVAGQGRNGRDALRKAELLKPDIITLDIEMPVMDGIEALDHITQNWPDVPVIMLSSTTKFGADATITALNHGAFTFIAKPAISGDAAREELVMHLSRAFREIERSTAGKEPLPHTEHPPAPKPHKKGFSRPEVVVMGASTGGPKALSEVIPALPGTLGCPLLLVQHMPAGFTRSLAESLNRRAALTVKEATDRETLRPNTVYIAPGGRHMKVHAGQIILTDDPPERHCRPSVNYLFRSAAREYGDRLCAVILTGMGDDGTEGLRAIKNAGNPKVIGQDENTCVVYGMPREAFRAGVVDVQVPLSAIAAEIGASLRP